MFITFTLTAFLLQSFQGPISKFEKRQSTTFHSAKSLEDLERCLIDLQHFHAPTIYRQPDRPDNLTIIWTVSDIAVGRIDLSREQKGTLAKSWELERDDIKNCL